MKYNKIFKLKYSNGGVNDFLLITFTDNIIMFEHLIHGDAVNWFYIIEHFRYGFKYMNPNKVFIIHDDKRNKIPIYLQFIKDDEDNIINLHVQTQLYNFESPFFVADSDLLKQIYSYIIELGIRLDIQKEQYYSKNY